MPAQISLGREIRRLRVASGMTLAELSGRTGMRESYLTAIEDDREEPSAPALQRLAGQLASAGTSYERLACFLTAPEFDVSGEYRHEKQAWGGTPALAGDDRDADQQRPLEPNCVATAAEDVWRHKTDVQLIDAARSLEEYTTEGRRVILAELDRRGLAARNTSGSQLISPDEPVTNLQFDHAEFDGANGRAACGTCHTSLADSYFSINGRTVCPRCCEEVRRRLSAGSGWSRALRATSAGLVAAGGGTMLYYTIRAVTGVELGLIAILVGFMVGKAVSRGSNGRGGWKYQTLAMVLTYLSIVTSYLPMIVKDLVKINARTAGAQSRQAQQRAESSGDTSSGGTASETSFSRRPEGPPRPTLRQALVGFAFLLLLACALPFFGGINNAMGLVIIAIGVYEAWKFNRKHPIVITGPHALSAPMPASPGV